MREEEICFIHDAKNEIQLEEIYADMRSRNKRVIIGSTPKMGTGMNIQDRLIVIHHLDCPYRPSDVGRSLRALIFAYRNHLSVCGRIGAKIREIDFIFSGSCGYTCQKDKCQSYG